MTVAKLIEYLQTCPADLPVCINIPPMEEPAREPVLGTVLGREVEVSLVLQAGRDLDMHVLHQRGLLARANPQGSS